MKNYWLIFWVGLGACQSHAAPFQNLGFDEADTNTTQFFNYSDITPPLHGIGPAEDLLPGWQLIRDGSPLTTLGYDFRSDELPHITLYSKALSASIEGNYALGLGILTSVVQRGDIPSYASLITFTGTPFIVTVNCTDLPNSYNSLPPTQNHFFFDISAYAGQNVELSFRPFQPLMSNNPFGTIDSIAFAPEPSEYLSFALGGGVLLNPWFRRRFRKSSTS